MGKSYPGQIVFTRMPFFAKSNASVFVKPVIALTKLAELLYPWYIFVLGYIPCFDMVYRAFCGTARRLRTEPMLMIEPRAGFLPALHGANMIIRHYQTNIVIEGRWKLAAYGADSCGGSGSCFNMCFSAALSHSQTPLKFTLIMRSKTVTSLSVVGTNGPPIPALLTT